MRWFRLSSLILIAAMVLGACTPVITPTPAGEPVDSAAEQPAEEPAATKAPEEAEPAAEQAAEQPEPVSKFGESPMMTDLVLAEALPTVEERLPINPMVVTPAKEVGQFGGDLRIGFLGNNPGWGGLWFFVGWENLVIWKPDFSGITPNIAESVDVSDDVKEYTFHLREGMKWSDGAPFTADDIMFYIEDVLFDPELNAGGPVADWLPTESREGFKAEKIDDYTVKFIFPQPNAMFLYNVATWSGRHITWFPKHYLTKFHKKYNPDVDQLLENEQGVSDWVALFNQKAAGPTADTQVFFDNPERPTLHPWMVTQPLGSGTTVLLERNPYYWKVDTAGNQLPYIDTITGITYQDAESRTFALLNGDIDILKDPGDENRPLYFEARDSGKPLGINRAISDGGTTNTVHFNQSIADEVKAEIFANKDFRIGMSFAINREEIIEIVHNGQGTPSQAAPLESSPLYNEQLATQYVEYNVDLANEYLDKVLPEKDAEGYRLDNNGKRMSIVLTVQNDQPYQQTWVQVAELLTGYWKAVGVEVKLNAITSTQRTEYTRNNQIEAELLTGEGGAGLTGILDPRYYVPMETFGVFGLAWYYWRVNDTSGATIVEPPQEMKDARAKFEKVLAAPTQEQQIELMKDVLQDAADNFYVIGIARPADSFQPYNTRVHNIPDEWIVGWIEGVQKIMYPEQWYLSE
jgi:peptide/nickel transport system substrate-binding protein